VTDVNRRRFQDMKQAYDVLVDPEKRGLYDQLGETGMMMVEDPTSVHMEKVRTYLISTASKRIYLSVPEPCARTE
jgi:DnaJ-class molecular chaperone